MKTVKIKASAEDEISRVKTFITELQKVQDEYFEKLCADLKDEDYRLFFASNEERKDFLFDYVYNFTHEYEDFGGYMISRGFELK